MGSVFLVPWTWADRPLECLKKLGFKTVALALTDRSVPLDYPLLKQESRLALVMGTEGDGLPQTAIDGFTECGGCFGRGFLGAPASR